MIERRAFIKMGLIAPAALSLPMTAFAAMPGIDAFVVDRRYLDVGGIGPTSVPVHVIDGDVTALWYHTLDTIWRERGFVLEGYSGADVLFVLEHLAWDRGRRVVHRELMEKKMHDGLPLVNWVIAPVHPSVTA